MKILFIHHSGLIGGAGVSLMNTIEALKANSYDVVLTLPPEPKDMTNLAKLGYGMEPVETERRIGAITCVSGIDRFFSLRFLYRLVLIFKQFLIWNQRIDEIDPEIVITNSKILCWMSLLPAVKNRKSICFVRETMRGKRKYPINMLIASLLDKYSKVVFLSKYDRDMENLKKTNTDIIHNYVSEMNGTEPHKLKELNNKWGLKKGRFCVLYVGGVSQLKGFHIAVKSVLSMGTDVDLIVAGINFEDIRENGNKSAVKYADEVKKYIDDFDLHKQIHLIGKQTNMAPCYESCDVLIFPMQAPHQARPVFEAGYFSKPVVISDFENIREFVKYGYNGFTANAKSVGEFTRELQTLKMNPNLCKQMGKNNNDYTQKNHSQNVVQRQIRDLIEESRNYENC